MKVLTVIGARPQFIKAAVVSNALRARNIEEFLVHTGQHFDENMSKIFFSLLKQLRVLLETLIQKLKSNLEKILRGLILVLRNF